MEPVRAWRMARVCHTNTPLQARTVVAHMSVRTVISSAFICVHWLFHCLLPSLPRIAQLRQQHLELLVLLPQELESACAAEILVLPLVLLERLQPFGSLHQCREGRVPVRD